MRKTRFVSYRETLAMNPQPATTQDFAVFAQQQDSYFKRHNLIVIDSGRLTLRALKAPGIVVTKVLCPEGFYRTHQRLLDDSGAQVLLADEAQTQAITGFRIHHGVMALAVRPLDRSLTDLGPRVIALNGVNNAENVGTIVRNALAFQAPAMIIDKQSCSPLLRRAIRVSMGSVFKCGIHHCQSLEEALPFMKAQGYQIVIAGITAESVALSEFAFSPKSVLVLGNEGEGVHGRVARQGDQTVHIPMTAEIDSLNVGVASGIFLNQMANSR